MEYQQRIQIKHLGPVKEMEMDIRDFNLLIGEQSVGKSTIAKAIYFFRMMKTTVTDYVCQLYDTNSYNGEPANERFIKPMTKELKLLFVDLFGYSWDLDDRLHLKYLYSDNIWIEVNLDKTKKYIDIQYSHDLEEKIEKLAKEALELYRQKSKKAQISLAHASQERLRNYDSFRNRVNTIFSDDKETYFIPAGRSMITLLAGNRLMVENLDLITRQFIRIIDGIQSVFSDGISRAHTRYLDGKRKFDVSKVAERIISCLKGDYRYEKGKGYLVTQDRRDSSDSNRISINFASSGQQEVLWLLNQLYVLMLKKENAFVIIEEPEVHLYPNLQNEVMEFISYFVNSNNSSVFITTHSPYVLMTVNSLYFAGKMIEEQEISPKKVRDIIGGNYEISPGKINVLKINKDQSMQNLVDKDMGEIRTEMIDEISDIIDRKYIDLSHLLFLKKQEVFDEE